MLRACRSNLPPDYVASASAAVQQRLLESSAYDAALDVILYAAKDNEIGTEQIFARAIASGRHVYFPKIIKESGQLSLVRVSGSEQFRTGAFGILEPTGAESVPVAILRQALICVPGLAFSPDGQRVGRGGGYYDRLLTKAGPQLVSAGLAYSFQVLDQLPQSSEDRRLNLIITESALFEMSAEPHISTSLAGQGGVPRC